MGLNEDLKKQDKIIELNKFIESMTEVTAEELEAYFGKERPYQLLELWYRYTLLAPFADNKAIKKFKNTYSLKDKHLIWFVSYVDLIEEVKKINQSELISVNESMVVSIIFYLYIRTKIFHTLMEAFDYNKMYDGKETNSVAIGLFKYNQNKENRLNRGLTYAKNEFERCMEEVEGLLIQSGTEQKFGVTPMKLFHKEAANLIDSTYLIPIYKEYTTPLKPRVSERKKMILMFDLFRFIMKDRKWLSEDEFYNSSKVDKEGNEIITFDNNYDQYRYKTMKKFIKK